MTVSNKKLASELWALIAVGGGVGWLIGQTRTSTIQLVLTSILAIIAAALSALAGVNREPSTPQDLTAGPNAQNKNKATVSVVPLALFVVPLCVVSSVSVAVRTHQWIAPSQASEIQEWVHLGIDSREVTRRIFEAQIPNPGHGQFPWPLGRPPAEIVTEWAALELDKKAVAQRLFDYVYARETPASDQAVSTSTRTKAELFSGVNEGECARLRAANKQELPSDMTASSLKIFQLLGKTTNPENLPEILEILCRP